MQPTSYSTGATSLMDPNAYQQPPQNVDNNPMTPFQPASHAAEVFNPGQLSTPEMLSAMLPGAMAGNPGWQQQAPQPQWSATPQYPQHTPAPPPMQYQPQPPPQPQAYMPPMAGAPPSAQFPQMVPAQWQAAPGQPAPGQQMAPAQWQVPPGQQMPQGQPMPGQQMAPVAGQEQMAPAQWQAAPGQQMPQGQPAPGQQMAPAQEQMVQVQGPQGVQLVPLSQMVQTYQGTQNANQALGAAVPGAQAYGPASLIDVTQVMAAYTAAPNLPQIQNIEAERGKLDEMYVKEQTARDGSASRIAGLTAERDRLDRNSETYLEDSRGLNLDIATEESKHQRATSSMQSIAATWVQRGSDLDTERRSAALNAFGPSWAELSTPTTQQATLDALYADSARNYGISRQAFDTQIVSDPRALAMARDASMLRKIMSGTAAQLAPAQMVPPQAIMVPGSQQIAPQMPQMPQVQDPMDLDQHANRLGAMVDFVSRGGQIPTGGLR